KNNSQTVRIASTPHKPNAKSRSAHKVKQKLVTVDNKHVKTRQIPITGYGLYIDMESGEEAFYSSLRLRTVESNRTSTMGSLVKTNSPNKKCKQIKDHVNTQESIT
ncbi:hypothetical protein Gohar_028039, partial [Gossypium harknessii]|nr:hypothetical protein [Gossypium harknessii]